ncbi:A104R [African swine fever virus]
MSTKKKAHNYQARALLLSSGRYPVK